MTEGNELVPIGTLATQSLALKPPSPRQMKVDKELAQGAGVYFRVKGNDLLPLDTF